MLKVVICPLAEFKLAGARLCYMLCGTYEKINVVSDRCQCLVSMSGVEPMVQNNRYLIPIKVTMHQMLGDNPILCQSCKHHQEEGPIVLLLATGDLKDGTIKNLKLFERCIWN